MSPVATSLDAVVSVFKLGQLGFEALGGHRAAVLRLREFLQMRDKAAVAAAAIRFVAHVESLGLVKHRFGSRCERRRASQHKLRPTPHI